MATILIVDDQEINNRILTHILVRKGHKIVSAYNGVEALCRLKEEPAIELVITDMNMPEMDGLSLLRSIRANRHYEQVPVVMLTASAQDQDRIAARSEGVTYFLTKPTSSVELTNTVNRVLNSSKVTYSNVQNT